MSARQSRREEESKMNYTEKQYIQQSRAELSVRRGAGLPMPAEGEAMLPEGIHVVLHVGDGVPSEGKAGDLVFICDLVSPDTCRILSAGVFESDGSIKPWATAGTPFDLPSIVSTWQ